MNGWKKHIAYLRRRIGRIKQWHLALVLATLLIVTGCSLRANNLSMVSLREQVVEADKAIDRDKVKTTAKNLRDYVSRHMNTNTGGVALQNLYDADVRAAFAAANNEINSDAYQVATENCSPKIAQSGYQGYATCVAETVNLSSEQIKTPELPNAALYYVSYVAPRLSFDLAGVSLVVTVVVFLTLSLRILTAVALGVISRKKIKL
jgi:hypothetical protein